MADDDIKLEIKIHDKEKLLEGIEDIADAPTPECFEEPACHYSLFKEALTEATIFFYSPLPEESARKMVDIFLEKSSAVQLSLALNSLWSGTPKRQSTEYHKALYLETARFIVMNEFGEFVKGPPELEQEEPWQDIFMLAKEAKESAPSRTSYPATISYKQP